MTTERLMLAFLMLVLPLAAGMPGCGGGSRPVPTGALASPYDTGQGVVWAVAPLRNESGVSVIDTLALTDRMTNEVQQIEGVSAIPVNRTIQAMEAAGLPSLNTPNEALAIARMLGADAILVGSVTAWDPYDPPSIGISVGLFARSATMQTPTGPIIDPMALQAASTDQNMRNDWPASQPVNAVASYLDASNQLVVAEIRNFAALRSDPSSGLGWRRYLKSMKSFSRFACFHVLQDLLLQERARLAAAAAAAAEQSAAQPESR